MAVILNIDTSSSICSVAVSVDGEIAFGLESSDKMDHSVSLAPFVKQCFEYLDSHNKNLDAVSVAGGPGSYTGLRIGLSMAKGICFGKDLPLIKLSTLQIMATRAIFTYSDITGEELIIPMIDARRMEVYAEVFDSSLKSERNASPIILDENSLSEYYNFPLILFIGDGTIKFKNLYGGKNAVWLGEGMSHAKYMPALSEKHYRNRVFADVAYSTPDYLKAYQTTQPKSKI